MPQDEALTSSHVIAYRKFSPAILHISGRVWHVNVWFNKKPAVPYSRAGRTTIGPGCLSAVFGMGTGVPTRVWPPAGLGCVGSGVRSPSGRSDVATGPVALCVGGRGRCGQAVGC